MNKNNNKMDLLGNAPVPQALMALGIPIMIGMLINALYNLVDAYFIGGLGESQMGAISIAFPLGQVVVGLGLMFGNGAASYLSRLLGRGDREAASKVASTALYSSVCIGAVNYYRNCNFFETYFNHVRCNRHDYAIRPFLWKNLCYFMYFQCI